MFNFSQYSPMSSYRNILQKNMQAAQLSRQGQKQSLHKISELSSIHNQKLQGVMLTESKKIENLLEKTKEKATELMASEPTALWGMWREYLTDSTQRSAMVFETLRKRGNVYLDHVESGMPPVLDFGYEVIIDGHDLSTPVNYLLLKIKPPKGVVIDEKRAPVMIIDPRAGHGAGIGGFKPDSQVGEAFADGHQVYFVAFRPMPEPTQTIVDVRDAEIVFLRHIVEQHPHSPKPIVVGNCQGGWAAMLLAAAVPDLMGPIVLNGSPMSYWAGKVGDNPMRYTGGMRGGAMSALMLADMGNGLFDGANLVANFEALNPGNSFFGKYYNLYSNVDTEAQRFLDFEKWWGGYCFMTEAEMRWILDNLFIGNKLATGEAILGMERVDLKAIKSPIIVFASHGDNITPPQQALNWIPDLYASVEEIKARGQRIVYMLHDSIGHLGIFVSSQIAGREHVAITDTVRAIEALSPGLYEMKLDDEEDRVHIRFEPRGMGDILALGDGRDDEELFTEVAQMSNINTEIYDRFVRPAIQNMSTPETAALMRESHPLRTQRVMFSDKNPIMPMLDKAAESITQERKPASKDNPFIMAEKVASELIETQLNLYRSMRDSMTETSFFSIYTSPLIKAIISPKDSGLPKHSMVDVRQMPEVHNALALVDKGGLAEGVVRILHLLNDARGYVRRTRLERELIALGHSKLFPDMDHEDIVKIVHQQALIVDFEPKLAIDSLPILLHTADAQKKALKLVMDIAGPRETMHPFALKMYGQIEDLLHHKKAHADEAPLEDVIVAQELDSKAE
jgi:pimeloyl-ACP methyl ester carboxylesterase